MPTYTAGTVASGDQSALQADKPFFLAYNALENYVTAPIWNADGDWQTASASATGYPGYRAHDRRWNLATKPNASGTTWYLIFDLTAGTTDAATIDTIVIGGHNLGDLTTPTISVEIASNTDDGFADDLLEIATFSPTTNERIVIWDLGASGGTWGSYTSVKYLRVKVALGASGIPQIGEIMAGKREQLPWRPDRPYDDAPLRSEVSDFSSKSGHTTRYTHYSGQFSTSLEFMPAGADPVYSINSTQTLRDMFKGAGYGTKPFLWCDEPWTNKASVRATRKAHFVLARPELSMPLDGPTLRAAEFELVEQPPFLEIEAV